MPWAVFVLLLANIALGSYLLVDRDADGGAAQTRSQEANGHELRIVRSGPPAPAAADGVRESAGNSASACLQWGSFTTAELERARADLARIDAQRVRTRDLGPAPAWWVHVPPLRSQDEAQRRARELEEAGLQDVRVIADGERWRNAISLGVFASEDAANAYLARLKEARVRNVVLVRREDLLRLGALLIVEPVPALAARVAELRASYPGTELRAVACPPLPQAAAGDALTKEPQ